MSEEPGGDESSFEERLKAAREQAGARCPADTSAGEARRPRWNRPWGIGLRVGIELVSALVVAVAIGYGLDWLFGTKPILTVVFVLWVARLAFERVARVRAEAHRHGDQRSGQGT